RSYKISSSHFDAGCNNLACLFTALVAHITERSPKYLRMASTPITVPLANLPNSVIDMPCF
ncbi:MAG: hypothetical protein ACJA1O_003671, partial [Spirosomataceae bacterium]